MGRVAKCSLREFEQAEDVNPEHTHEVSVPTGNFGHDAPVLDGTSQQRSETRVKQRQNSNRKMHGVGAGKNVKEQGWLAGGKMKTVRREPLPGDPLSGKKRQAELIVTIPFNSSSSASALFWATASSSLRRMLR